MNAFLYLRLQCKQRKCNIALSQSKAGRLSGFAELKCDFTVPQYLRYAMEEEELKPAEFGLRLCLGQQFFAGGGVFSAVAAFVCTTEETWTVPR